MKKIIFLLLLNTISFAMPAQQYVVKLNYKNREELKQLSNYMDIDHVTDNVFIGYIWGIQKFEQFKKLGKPYTLVNDNKSKSIDMAINIGQMNNWDKYPTYDTYVAMMENFANTYPSLCALDTIGYSVNNRLILAVKISDNVQTHEAEPEFFYTSSMHGDELTGYVLMLRFIDWLLHNYNSDSNASYIVDNMEIYINPLSNPDGAYNGGNNTVAGAIRYNSNGKDLNRNFPIVPDSKKETTKNVEKENQAMIDFAKKHNFVMSANFHGGVELANYPWDTWAESFSPSKYHADYLWWRKITKNYANSCHENSTNDYFTDEDNGTTNGGDWYVIDGGRQDYMNYFEHCREMTLEISHTKLVSSEKLPDFWNYQQKAIINYAKEATYGFNGTVTDELGKPLNCKIIIPEHDKDNSFVRTDTLNGDYYRPIKPGTYNVTYYVDECLSKTITITVPDWKTKIVQNVIIDKNITVKGKITDPITNANLPNTNITFYGKTNYNTTTDENGEFTITLPKNNYQIKTFLTGYSSIDSNINCLNLNKNIELLTMKNDTINFENNIPDVFSYSGNKNWQRTTTQSYSGNASMKSGNIKTNEISTLTLTANFLAGKISFYKKISSENAPTNDSAFLQFSIDGNIIANWDGETDWSKETFDIKNGNHTIKWEYVKNNKTSAGNQDCAWIDFIETPKLNVKTHKITFNIRNNNIQLPNATVHLTGYGTRTTGKTEPATYHNVIQVPDSIQYNINIPDFETITGKILPNKDTTIVINFNQPQKHNEKNNNTTLKTYPNPTNGIINIQLPKNKGQIIIHNINGTIVLKKSTNNQNITLDLSSLMPGIYFLKFITKKQIFIKKLILTQI